MYVVLIERNRRKVKQNCVYISKEDNVRDVQLKVIAVWDDIDLLSSSDLSSPTNPFVELD